MAAVTTEIDGPVGRITLNRPDAYNAINTELARALTDALRTLADDVNVITIRGAGHHFSVGGDFNELERLRAEGADAMRALFESFAAACEAIASVPIPVVTLVEGYAMAGGFELVQAADIALVRADCTLSDNHTNFGLIPGGGSSQRLPRLVGRQRALGLILTGDRIRGADAEAWGLAYRSFEPDAFEQGAEAVVQGLAAKSRAALARCKQLVRDGLETELADGIRMETDAVIAHLQSDAAGEAFERFAARSGA